MLGLEQLTEGDDAELDEQLEQAMKLALTEIDKVEPNDYDGSIQAGVGSEALARYHRRNQDGLAAAALSRLAEHWNGAYWNDDGKLFVHKHSKDTGAGVGFLLTYGLGYAAGLSNDVELSARLGQMVAEHVNRATDPKSFAMRFRSTQRALELLSPPSQQ